MRYWVIEPGSKQRRGPYTLEQLRELDWLRRDTLTAPEGAKGAGSWRPAREFPQVELCCKAAPPPRPSMSRAGSFVKLGLAAVLACGIAAGAVRLFLQWKAGSAAAPVRQEEPDPAAAPARKKAARLRGRRPRRGSKRRRGRSRRSKPKDERTHLELPDVASVEALTGSIEKEAKEEEARAAAAAKAAREVSSREFEGKGDARGMSVEELDQYLRRDAEQEAEPKRAVPEKKDGG